MRILFKMFITVMLALVAAATLASCNSDTGLTDGENKAETKDDIDKTENISSEKADTEKVLSPESAVDIYMAYKDVWMENPSYTPMGGYGYCLLDLDFDGVLELINSVNNGSGKYSVNKGFRINPETNTVESLEDSEALGEYDYYYMASEKLKLLKNKSNNSMLYYCTDYVHVGNTEHCLIYGKLCSENKELQSDILFFEYEYASDAYNSGETVKEYYYYENGEKISANEALYEQKKSEFFDEYTDLNLSWRAVQGNEFDKADDNARRQLLLAAYRSFSYDGFSYDNIPTYDIPAENKESADDGESEETNADSPIVIAGFQFPYQYDTSEYIKITEDDYIGIQYSTYEIEEEDVYAEIQTLLEEYAIYTDVIDRPARNGDYVNIDYKGFIDGVAIETAVEEGAEFILGEGSFIPGFQEGIVGHTIGETFVVDAYFPEDYGLDEFDGKTAQFEMTLNRIETVEYPTLTDEFVRENTEFDTVREYYDSTKKELEERYASSIMDQQKNEAFEKICNNVEIIDYPEEEYRRYYNKILSLYQAAAQESNQTLEEYVASQGDTMDNVYSYIEAYVESSISTELVFFTIAKNENILSSLTQADYDSYLNRIAAEYLSTPEDFEEMNGTEAIWKSLVFDKVMDFVLENGEAE